MPLKKRKYSKPPTTVAEQLNLLRQRGLEIQDEDLSALVIKRVGFYRFKGFAHALCDHSLDNKPFFHGTHFGDVLHLIELDDQLRLKVFSGIQILEPAIRTAINEKLCWHNGIRWYEDKSVFTEEFLENSKGFSFEKFQVQRERQFHRSKDESFVKHYNERYDTIYGPPAWMLTETLNMGSWSLIFSHIRSSAIRTEIAACFGIHWKRLQNWRHSLTAFRNACAHHGRIWNRQFGVQPSLKGESADFLGRGPLTTHNRVGAQLLVWVQLLNSVQPDFPWGHSLLPILDSLPPETLKTQMGLQPNWHEHSLFGG